MVGYTSSLYSTGNIKKVVANNYLGCNITLRDISTSSKKAKFMLNNTINHEFFMQEAYQQALLAYKDGEVPIGAVLVKNGQIIAKSYNKTITSIDPTAHAEVLVIKSGALHINNYRLNDTVLYVTLEPCIMCLGAIVQARVSEIVYASDDTRVGCLSRQKYHLNVDINHNLKVTSGIMGNQCKDLLKKFFLERRSKKL